jgi:Protein of unknown function (DUF229)
MNWDSMLYDNTLTCKDPFFDDMRDEVLEKLMQKSGKSIVAWPTIDMLKKNSKENTFMEDLYHFMRI